MVLAFIHAPTATLHRVPPTPHSAAPAGRSSGITRLLALRHGESEWNALGRWQGQADPPLTDLGRLQAFHAARNLGVVDAIVASDLQRATDTARIISEALGVGPVVSRWRIDHHGARMPHGY